jgi:hypothetical protein
MHQLSESFRALGCDDFGVKFVYGFTDPNKKYHFHASWTDATGAAPVVVDIYGVDPLQLMVLGGLTMSERLAEQRPDLKFPDVVWT